MKTDTTTYRFETVGQMVDGLKPPTMIRTALYNDGYWHKPLAELQRDIETGWIRKTPMIGERSFARIKRMMARSRVHR